jgi:peptide-methionine (R)-S-oxide reductase
MNIPIKRRGFLRTAALSAISIPAIAIASRVHATSQPGDNDFQFEIIRIEEEWRAMLTDFEFGILREGKTEPQRTSPQWNETREGTYYCRGCDLHVYDSTWQIVVDKGWVFFRQNVPNAVLMGIDNGYPPSGMANPEGSPLAAIEAHCRRCGSHLGHILPVGGMALHCTNGTSFKFELANV